MISRQTICIIRLNGDTQYSSESRTDVSIRRRAIGYIFQHDTLFPHMTAGENIAYAARGGARSVVLVPQGIALPRGALPSQTQLYEGREELLQFMAGRWSRTPELDFLLEDGVVQVWLRDG